MKKIIFAMIPALIFMSCAGTASVEVGLNDEGLTLGLYGDLKMRILEVELFDGETYQTLWEGSTPITVSVQSADFVSISNGYEVVNPGSFTAARVTVDSLRYTDLSADIMLADAAIVFNAAAFTAIEIADGDEMNLVINVKSVNWFDMDSLKIISGKTPFEGAALKVYYPGT
ncbi:MAG TPA: hypothetical protein VF399_13155 [bacterium]